MKSFESFFFSFKDHGGTYVSTKLCLCRVIDDMHALLRSTLAQLCYKIHAHRESVVGLVEKVTKPSRVE